MFDGIIIYDTIDGHFVVKIGHLCYDIRGKLNNFSPSRSCYYWDSMMQEDPLQYERILSDCVYKIKNKD
jgi:hypothetical protein